MTIKFTVPGIPTPKGRPRFRQAGNHVQTYTPYKTVLFENRVMHSYYEYRRTHPDIDLDTMRSKPLRVEMRFYMPVPKGTSKKNMELMYSDDIKPDKRPDIDNLAKSVLDGLNGIAYVDDKQIVSLNCSKHYGALPRTEVTITTTE